MLYVYVWGLGAGGRHRPYSVVPLSIQELNSRYTDLFSGTHFPEPTVLNTSTLISHIHTTSLMFSVFFPLHLISAKRLGWRVGILQKRLRMSICKHQDS